MLFVSMLHREGLAPGTVKSCMAVVRFEQISRGMGDPRIGQMSLLEYVLKGFKRKTPNSTRCKLPITPEILKKLRQVWDQSPQKRDAQMLWAASCLCFFGFLRSGEIGTPTCKDYDQAYHLCVDDVRVNSRSSPTFIQVRIKASKMDPYRQGVMIYVGRTANNLCPVAAVLTYMVARGQDSGPLFKWENGQFLTREAFVAAVRKALAEAGIAPKDYSGRSFRIGAATTAAQQGLQDSLIKTLGRWESSAYTIYIRTPPATLCKVAKSLVSATTP